MAKVISFDSKYGVVARKDLKFRLRVCPMIDGKSQYDAVLITLKDNTSEKVIEITSFSKMFLENNLINKRLNTRKNLAKAMVMFLNHVHFDREFIERTNDKKKQKNLSRIEDVQVKDFDLFIDDYKKGKAGSAVYVGETKAKGSVQQIEQRLAKFGYFLVHHYNMNYLRKMDFKVVIKKKKISGDVVEYASINSPFNIIYPTKHNPRERLKNISLFAVTELIKIASEIKPMFALPIAMGAYSGVRCGETCNASYFNTQYTYLGFELQEYKIDLRDKPQLRSDGVDVGQIKSREIAYVHPAFLPFFNMVLNFHEDYRKRLRKVNKFGAMFLNRDGKAMTEKDYSNGFKILVAELIKRLYATGDPRAISEAKLMQTMDFQPHTLRYFFSQTIAKLPNITIFDIAMFRRDKTLDSALTYIRNNP